MKRLKKIIKDIFCPLKIIRNNKRVKYCHKCGLPSNFPGVKLGLFSCNYCSERDKLLKNKQPSKNFCYTPPLDEENRLELRNKMDKYFKKISHKKNKCHGVIAFSGGKDSTFSLYRLITDYKLKIVPVTVNIGCLNKNAIENIDHVFCRLNINNGVIIDDYINLFQKVYVYFLNQRKTICAKGSNPKVCLVCHHIIDMILHHYAVESGASFIVSGLDRFQTPPELNFMLSNPLNFYSEIGGDRLFNILTKYWPKDLFKNVFSVEEINILKNFCKGNMKYIYPNWFYGTKEKDLIKKLVDNKLIKSVTNTNCIYMELEDFIHWNKFGYTINEFSLSNRRWENNIGRKDENWWYEETFVKRKQEFFRKESIRKLLKWLDYKGSF